MNTRQEIESFFTSYIDAFSKKDAKKISELWEPVGLFPSPTGNFSMERDAFREHCVSLLDFYAKKGVTTPMGELLSVDELFPNVAQARMAYRMIDKDGQNVAKWEHVYILRKNNVWRVALTIADDEMAAWSALET